MKIDRKPDAVIEGWACAIGRRFLWDSGLYATLPARLSVRGRGKPLDVDNVGRLLVNAQQSPTPCVSHISCRDETVTVISAGLGDNKPSFMIEKRQCTGLLRVVAYQKLDDGTTFQYIITEGTGVESEQVSLSEGVWLGSIHRKTKHVEINRVIASQQTNKVFDLYDNGSHIRYIKKEGNTLVDFHGDIDHSSEIRCHVFGHYEQDRTYPGVRPLLRRLNLVFINRKTGLIIDRYEVNFAGDAYVSRHCHVTQSIKGGYRNRLRSVMESTSVTGEMVIKAFESAFAEPYSMSQLIPGIHAVIDDVIMCDKVKPKITVSTEIPVKRYIGGSRVTGQGDEIELHDNQTHMYIKDNGVEFDADIYDRMKKVIDQYTITTHGTVFIGSKKSVITDVCERLFKRVFAGYRRRKLFKQVNTILSDIKKKG